MYQEKFPGARDSFCLRGEAYFRTLQYDFNKFELFMEGGGSESLPKDSPIPEH